MTNIRRYYHDGYTYFITCVTYNRRRILIKYHDLFWDVVNHSRNKFSYNIIAWTVLQDHFHFIIQPENTTPSQIIKYIKQSFAMRYLNTTGFTSGAVWQLRFWDHVIRDEEDMKRHVDYIHFNGVKHGLTKKAIEYPYSSISLFRGQYSDDWELKMEDEKSYEFGE